MVKENFSATFLLERGIEHLQQKRYAEGMTLFTLVGECFTPEKMHLATSLDRLIEEHAKYSQIQQKLQKLSDQLIEVQGELNTCNHTLDVLRSILLTETQSEHSAPATEHVHQQLRSMAAEDKANNPTLYAICLGPFEVRRMGTPIAICSV